MNLRSMIIRGDELVQVMSHENPKYDKLSEIRQFLDTIRSNFPVIGPETRKGINKIIVRTKARYGIRQYKPEKPFMFEIFDWIESNCYYTML